MRVVMIDPGNLTPFYDFSLCQALAATGCTVELISAPYPYAGLPCLAVPARAGFGRVGGLPALGRSRRLRRVARALEYPLDWLEVVCRVRATRPDVVHVQWAMLPPIDALAFRALRRLGTRLIYTVHDLRHYPGWHQAWRDPRPLFALADELIVHTTANAETLAAVSSLSRSRIHVVPLGNFDDFVGPPLSRVAARAALGLPPTAPLALFFGAIKPYKGLDGLIEAFPRVLARLPSARLLIAGHPAESFSRYQRAIERLELGDRVTSHVGFVPKDEVARYFSAADVVVLPYTETSFSAVLVTAYTFGRPVVVTQTGGLPESVEDGATGYVVPPRDPVALAAAISRVLADPRHAEQMGERARALAQTRYSWSAIAESTRRLYVSGARR